MKLSRRAIGSKRFGSDGLPRAPGSNYDIYAEYRAIPRFLIYLEFFYISDLPSPHTMIAGSVT